MRILHKEIDQKKQSGQVVMIQHPMSFVQFFTNGLVGLRIRLKSGALQQLICR